uniref:Uncharacterized protein n=1 Tax=viral metagenome TaxID=1070528 RepID=A0A6C0J3R2_9ZZZZ
MYQQSRKRNDSIDSRSHSFDSTENEKTKPLKIKSRRKRNPPLVQTEPSPIPDKNKYFIHFQNSK